MTNIGKSEGTSGELTVYDVANYLLARQDPASRPMSNMKLQKLLYFAYGLTLALLQRPLWDISDFRQRVTAYKWGPVVPAVRKRYGGRGDQPVPVPQAVDLSHYDPTVRAMLDTVLERWGHLSPEELSRLTHEHTPWAKAYKKGLVPGAHYTDDIIPDEDIEAFFRRMLSPQSGKETPAELSAQTRSQPGYAEDRAEAKAQIEAGKVLTLSELQRSLGF
jgi:uncharacterized phage-associated protein